MTAKTTSLMNLAGLDPVMMSNNAGKGGTSGSCPGWLMTAVAPWGENAEDAYDQGLVELGLGDSRLIEVQGAFLPMGFRVGNVEQQTVIGNREPPRSGVVGCHIPLVCRAGVIEGPRVLKRTR